MRSQDPDLESLAEQLAELAKDDGDAASASFKIDANAKVYLEALRRLCCQVSPPDEEGVGKMDSFVEWFESFKEALSRDACSVGLLQDAFLAGWKRGYERARDRKKDLPL